MAGQFLKKNSKWPQKTKFLKLGKWGINFYVIEPVEHEFDNIRSIWWVFFCQNEKKIKNKFYDMT